MSVAEVIQRRSLFLKRTFLAFWSVWLTLVFATNVCDAGKALGLLGESWKFASGNFNLVVQTTLQYDTPSWANGLLFLSVVCWEGLAATLFWRAWWHYRGGKRAGTLAVYTAFTVSLALWAAFLIASEVFISYAIEAAFLRLFIAQLATLLTIELLPEGDS
jgi:hypothetical protein